jgi:hypothetical protein
VIALAVVGAILLYATGLALTAGLIVRLCDGDVELVPLSAVWPLVLVSLVLWFVFVEKLYHWAAGE